MSLANRTTLGPYEILSPLGAGGMGEVYRAKDTRLDREVAVKILPDVLGHDEERVARFEREAKLLASLNHPNIAAIHGFEEYDGKRLLVMELVEGQTLGERIKTGSIPVEEALTIARQMAEALEAAHEKGVIHRDLKPANVMIRPDGTVKVLDFGLAKALAGGDDRSQTDIGESPTITADYTKPGMILGTAAYMSPEQARGKPLDKRTDIWSFGCVLFECLGGSKPFEGDTATDLIAKILERDPDWDTLPANTPPIVHLLLRRCLQKHRDKRLHDISDARVELEEAIADPTSSSLRLATFALAEATRPPRWSAWGRLLPWALVLASVAALAVSLAAPWRTARTTPRPSMHLNVEVSPTVPLASLTTSSNVGAQAVISPDGTRLVFVAGSGEDTRLYLRSLDQTDATPLSGSEGAVHPFFSPDSRWVGFFTEDSLNKVSVFGGASLTLCSVGSRNRGGSWTDDGHIVFANLTTGLMRVPESGGTPEQITTLDKEKQERSHRWPHVLPGGRAVLFTSQTQITDFNSANIELVSLDTQKRWVLHRGGSYGRYLSSGHLIFVHEGTVFAAPFDLTRLKLTGTPAPVLEGVMFEPASGGARLSCSDTGTLLYSAGDAAGQKGLVVWMNRQGEVTTLLDTEREYGHPRLSPDGSRLALHIFETNKLHLWVYEIQRSVLVRLTFSAEGDLWPLWTPDGKRLTFASFRDGFDSSLYWKPADGSGEVERLTTSEHPQFPTSWSPDGTTLAFEVRADDTVRDIWVFRVGVDGPPEPFLQTPFNETNAVFSPDGRWLAYESDESGTRQIYVRPFPGPGGKWQISTDGGRYPRWPADGNELFYRNGDKMMAAVVNWEGSSLQSQTPRELFATQFVGLTGYEYDVASDGERFVVIKRPDEEAQPERSQIMFVLNWFEELKAKAPTGGNR